MKNIFSKVKENKKMIWAIGGQVLFAIFIIIAMYAIEFRLSPKVSADLKYFKGGFPNYNDESTQWGENLYGLSIAGIVIAFVGILMPLVSLFYKNDKVNFALGWTTILFDVAAFTFLIAAVSLFADNYTISKSEEKFYKGLSRVRYDKGYLAGQFIFIFVGAGLAFAGLSISYKDNLLKLA